MRIVISRPVHVGRAEAHVTDPENFRELSVESTMVGTEDAGRALTDAGLGDLADTEHAWLDIARLRELSRTGAADWDESFAAMIAFAARQGWVDDTGSTVRAHCVWK